MGKTTYMAIGRPLPHRKTIVVTRGELDDERVEVRHDLLETIQEYKNKKEDLFICGGASIYKQALPYVDELIISRIPGKHEGETYFPSFDEYNFQRLDDDDDIFHLLCNFEDVDFVRYFTY